MPFEGACRSVAVTTTQTIAGAKRFYGCMVVAGSAATGSVIIRKLNSTGTIVGAALASTANGAVLNYVVPVATEGVLYTTVTGAGATASVLLDGYTTIS